MNDEARPGRPLLAANDQADGLAPFVATVQRITGVNPDGIFGPRTEDAVRAFQRRERLADTGVVDAATWERIDAALLRSTAGIGHAITIAATTDIGQRETVAFLGFADKAFERDLQALGWHRGEAWDDRAALLWWKAAYSAHPEIVAALDRIFEGSPLRTFKNFERSGRFIISQQPRTGALCFDRFALTKARVSVVTRYHVGADVFRYVAGRSQWSVSREGYVVAEDEAPVVVPSSIMRARMGFVYPIEV